LGAASDEHFAIPQPSPVAALEYYLESRGLTRKALEPFIGSAQRVDVSSADATVPAPSRPPAGRLAGANTASIG
jgi:hypothetical protein